MYIYFMISILLKSPVFCDTCTKISLTRGTCTIIYNKPIQIYQSQGSKVLLYREISQASDTQSTHTHTHTHMVAVHIQYHTALLLLTQDMVRNAGCLSYQKPLNISIRETWVQALTDQERVQPCANTDSNTHNH